MITTLEALRERYPAPTGRALAKQIGALDIHCERFVMLSPFVVIASGTADQLDASPRGGAPGFIKVTGPNTLLIPDSSGNNRLDTLTNIIESGNVGLLFLIPGIDETLRVNGRARLSDEAALLQHFAQEPRPPKLVIEVSVTEAYLHCAKALMRSKLWAEPSRQPRSVLPSTGQILSDHTGITGPIETQEQMLARYAPEL